MFGMFRSKPVAPAPEAVDAGGAPSTSAGPKKKWGLFSIFSVVPPALEPVAENIDGISVPPEKRSAFSFFRRKPTEAPPAAETFPGSDGNDSAAVASPPLPPADALCVSPADSRAGDPSGVLSPLSLAPDPSPVKGRGGGEEEEAGHTPAPDSPPLAGPAGGSDRPTVLVRSPSVGAGREGAGREGASSPSPTRPAARAPGPHHVTALLSARALSPTWVSGSPTPGRGRRGAPDADADVRPLASTGARFEASLRGGGGPLPQPTPVRHEEAGGSPWALHSPRRGEEGSPTRGPTVRPLASSPGGRTDVLALPRRASVSVDATRGPTVALAPITIAQSMSERALLANLAAAQAGRADAEARAERDAGALAAAEAACMSANVAAARLQVALTAAREQCATTGVALEAAVKEAAAAVAAKNARAADSVAVASRAENGEARARAELIEAQLQLKQAAETLSSRAAVARGMRDEIDDLKHAVGGLREALDASEAGRERDLASFHAELATREAAVEEALSQAAAMSADHNGLVEEVSLYRAEAEAAAASQATAEAETERLRAHVSEAARKLAAERHGRALAERRAEALTRYVKANTAVLLEGEGEEGTAAAARPPSTAPSLPARRTGGARHMAGSALSPARSAHASRLGEGAPPSAVSAEAEGADSGDAGAGDAAAAVSAEVHADAAAAVVRVEGLEAALKASRGQAATRGKRIEQLQARLREGEEAGEGAAKEVTRLGGEVAALKRRAEAAEGRAAYLAGVLKGLKEGGAGGKKGDALASPSPAGADVAVAEGKQ